MKKVSFFIFLCFVCISLSLNSQNWSPPKRLTWNSGSSGNAFIVLDSLGILHLVWSDSTPGNKEIFHKQSSDNGDSWSSPLRLTWRTGTSWFPQMAADSNNNFFVTWADSPSGDFLDFDIYVKKSSDNGLTCSPPTRLTWSYGLSDSPFIAVDTNDVVFIFWSDTFSGNSEIYLKQTLDSGNSWGPLKRLTWTDGQGINPHVCFDSQNVIHLFWNENFSDDIQNYEIFYKKSTDSGNTWVSLKRLTWTSGNSRLPHAVISSTDDIHLVYYEDLSGNKEIFYRKSADGGATWSSPKRLTWNLGESSCPRILRDSKNTLYVFWHDESSGNYEIFFKTSGDEGTTWSSVNRLSWNSGLSVGPSATVDSADNLYLVWTDTTPGNAEIFFKFGTNDH